ncbi:IS5 family transposase [Rhodoferax sp. BLA1]|uniref:IS5 family transposase n=1 Tax=Rhodoferax sp. BLA1 TaxID=2576062 RepID=UPI0015D464AE|nr:IS5 family transposase [Rhodoferax sp. BLA1]
MKSSANQASFGFFLCTRKTRKALFLDEMARVVPWARLVDIIAPHYPEGLIGRPPFPLEVMMHTHFLQQWFNLSDPAMEEAFFDIPLYREFVNLGDNVRLPDESTILRFRHLLEKHSLADKMLAEVNALLIERGLMLKGGSAVDATLIAAPSSTKNKDKARDPEMHSSQKGRQWHFGMKAHIGVDAHSGLVHTVRCTSGNAHDITQAHRLLHGQEKTVWADAGYQGVEKRPGADPHVTWHVAMRPGKRKVLKQAGPLGEVLDKAEKLKAGIRAKVEHPFRVIKRQFGYIKTRYRRLKKNAAQIATLFALSNLWMARRDWMAVRA